MPVIEPVQRNSPEDFEFIFHCPGCGCCHGFKTDGPGPTWTFNGDMTKPTLNPSLMVRHGMNGGAQTCHSFVKDGMIEFLPDCTHALAGKTVPLEEV